MVEAESFRAHSRRHILGTTEGGGLDVFVRNVRNKGKKEAVKRSKDRDLRVEILDHGSERTKIFSLEQEQSVNKTCGTWDFRCSCGRCFR